MMLIGDALLLVSESPWDGGSISTWDVNKSNAVLLPPTWISLDDDGEAFLVALGSIFTFFCTGMA